MKPILIGIVGKKESGKDEIVKIIKEKFKYNANETVIRLAFADALKVEVSGAMDITLEELEKNKNQYRLILQGWGTDFRRAKNSLYWITKYISQLNGLSNDKIKYILTPDVRFENEAHCIKMCGGKIWRVTRGNILDNKDEHISEVEQDKIICDQLIYNNASLEDLKQQVIKLLV